MPDISRRTVLRSVPAVVLGAGVTHGVNPVTAQADDDAGDDPSGSRTDVRVVSLEHADPVENNRSDLFLVRAPAGRLLEIQAITLSVEQIAPATTGTHSFEVRPANTEIRLLFGAASDNEPLSFDGVTWEAADDNQVPTDPAAQQRAIRGLLIDEDGLVVEYRNRTNGRQNRPRGVQLWVIDRPADGAERRTNGD
jgi:hypothetical protein